MKKKAIDKEENYNVYKYRMLNYSFVNFDFALKKYVEKFEKSLNDYIKKMVSLIYYMHRLLFLLVMHVR